MKPSTLLALLLRMGLSGFRRRFWRQRFSGDAEDICRAIVQACYDPKRGYFCTSTETYREMWARDFGRSVPALIQCGFSAEVASTYRFALRAYRQADRFALAVLPDGTLYDFPFGTFSPDGFAFFLYGLCALKDYPLIEDNREFLERCIGRFVHEVIDPETGRVRSNRHFSEARDYVKRSSSCYSNTICFLLQQSLERLGLSNPLSSFDYPAILMEHFYDPESRSFRDDLQQTSGPSADACILPFWVGMNGFSGFDANFDETLAYLDRTGLSHPLPARYGNGDGVVSGIWLERLNPWQRDAVWTCLGLHLLEALSLYNPSRFRRECDRYIELVESHSSFPEVLDPQRLRLYRSCVYTAENTMIWAANLLALIRDPGGFRHVHLR
jgi:hypothetical protein